MARPGPASFAKRKREMDKKARKAEKRELREQRKAEKAERAEIDHGGQDPDLIGIELGPQPPREDEY